MYIYQPLTGEKLRCIRVDLFTVCDSLFCSFWLCDVIFESTWLDLMVDVDLRYMDDDIGLQRTDGT